MKCLAPFNVSFHIPRTTVTCDDMTMRITLLTYWSESLFALCGSHTAKRMADPQAGFSAQACLPTNKAAERWHGILAYLHIIDKGDYMHATL